MSDGESRMNEEDIQHLQSQVDELSGLCSEALGPDDLQTRRHERLGIMLLKLQDGDLETRYIRRLEKWLLTDPIALQFYVDFMNLSALLSFHFQPNSLSPDRFCPVAHA